jgi:hypothetical protein
MSSVRKDEEKKPTLEELKQQKMREDRKLDEDLMQTFPASDPISYSKPASG